MSWDAIGAIGEIIGAIAVIATLFYLATQVRVGNNLSKTNTFREIMHGMVNHTNFMWGPENAELMAKGFLSYKDLTGEEHLRCVSLFSGYFQFIEDSWNSTQADLLKGETMDNWKWYLGDYIFRYEGARDWWEEYRQAYDPEVSAWVDNILNSTEVSGDPFRLRGS